MDVKTLVSNTRLYLFDMDGTLYLGDRLYDFTIELLQEIRRTGGKYLFITNNSSKSVADYVKKLAGFGIEATRDDFMTYLIRMGVDADASFKIMEAVRKGVVAKGKSDKWPEWKADMLAHML